MSDLTIIEIRDSWARQQTREHDWTLDTAKEMFDAALAAHDKQIEAVVWDEGFDAGERDVHQHQTFDEPCIPNPYREVSA